MDPDEQDFPDIGRVFEMDLAPIDRVRVRQFALSTALNAPSHEWHGDPFMTADKIIHWVMTGEHGIYELGEEYGEVGRKIQ